MTNINVFVGRINELEILSDALISVNQGNGKLILIDGEPGSGKSSLIRYFINQNKKDALTAIVECADKEGLMAWQPFKSTLEQLNVDNIANSDEEKTEILSGLKEVMKDVGADWISKIPLIGQFADIAFLGIKTAKSARKHFSKQIQETEAVEIKGAQQIFSIIEKELRRLAQKKTIIIFLDDLQWTDKASLNMLFKLSRSLRSEPFPLLLIGSYRPHEIKHGRNIITEMGDNKIIRHPFQDKLNELRNYTKSESHISRTDKWLLELSLKPFDKDEVKQLIDAKCPNNNFQENFYTEIIEKTDGHVLFISETLDYLIENENIFKNDDGVFNINNSKSVDFPQSIVGVISERLQRLDEQLRKIIEVASVSGEDFSLQIIETILKIDELDLLDYFEELNKKHGLLLPHKSLMIKDLLLELYRFSNTYVQKYIYDNLDAPRRRILHKKTALVIKKLYANDIERDEQIKMQYNKHIQIANGLIEPITGELIVLEKSEMKSNTSEIIQLAETQLNSAKTSYNQFALDECIEYANRTIAFLNKIEKHNEKVKQLIFDAFEYKQKAISWKGNYNKAKEIAEEMFVSASENTNNKNIATAYRLLGKEYRKLGMYEKALTVLQEETKIVELLNNQELVSKNYSDIGWVLSLLARYNEAIQFLEKSKKIAQHINHELFIANADNRLGNIYRSISKNEESLKYFQKALTIYEKLNVKERISAVNNNMGLTYQSLDDYEKAAEKFRNSLDINLELNNLIDVANDYSNFGTLYLLKGNFSESEEFFNKSLITYERIDDKVGLSQIYVSLGMLNQSVGDFSGALEKFQKSLEINTQLKDKLQMALDYVAISGLQKNTGDYPLAINNAKQAIKIYEELEDESGIALAQSSLGAVYNNSGAYQLAIEMMQKVLETYIKLEVNSSIASAYNELGSIYKSTKKYDIALENFNKALVIFQKTEDKPNLSVTYNYIGALYYQIDEYKKALDYYHKGLEIDEELDNKMNMATSYNNIAGIFKHNSQEYDKAIEYYKKAINIIEKTDDKISFAIYTENLAKTYTLINANNEALELFQKSLEINIELSRFNDISSNFVGIADVYLDEKKYEKAIKNYYKALEYAEKANDEEYQALVYSNIGYTYHSQNELEKAIGFYKKAINLYEITNNPESLIRNIRNIIFAAIDLKNIDEAVFFFQRIIEIHSSKNNFEEVVNVYIEIAELYSNLNENKIAIEYYTEAIAIAEKYDLSEKIHKLYNDRGVEYYSINDAENSLIDYHWALKFNEKNNNISNQVLNLKNIAEIYFSSNNFDDGFKYIKKALDKSLDLEDLTNYVELMSRLASIYTKNEDFENSNTYNRFGIFYEELKLYQKALEMYEKSLEMNMDLKLSENIALNCRNIGDVHVELNNFQQALDYYERAELIFSAEKNTKYTAFMNYRIGYLLFNNLDDSEKAIVHLLKANELYLEVEEFEMVALVKYYLGKSYIKNDNPKEAINQFVEASEINEKLEEYVNQADCVFEIGSIFKENEQYNEAIDYFNKSVEIFHKNNEQYKVAKVYFEFGNISRKTKDCSKSVEFLEKSLEIFINLEATYDVAITNIELSFAKKCLEKTPAEIIEKNLRVALKIFVELDIPWQIARIYYLIAKNYTKENSRIEAKDNFELSIKYFKTTTDFYSLAIAHDNFGDVYLFEEELQKAYDNFKTAYKLMLDNNFKNEAEYIKTKLEKLIDEMHKKGITYEVKTPSEPNSSMSPDSPTKPDRT